MTDKFCSEIQEEMSGYGFSVYSAETKNGDEAEFINEKLPNNSEFNLLVVGVTITVLLLAISI
ncbi:MAG: hypothetical protein GKR93_06925 [Gammaproteobacteria bacterium]|nr:hypothetical protein [Gammaproteobacteria bacterium]